MKNLLQKSNKEKIDLNGKIPSILQKKFRSEYREILKNGERETLPPDPSPPGKRGRLKKYKARNLLERLRDYEEETLRFITAENIPFTNNQGERDIRMTKVQQKISGCFRSENGAKYFSRIRGFISTCRKHDVSLAKALKDLFLGILPEFFN